MSTSRGTALVTGGNRGIGFETARQLAQLGYTVWMGSRDQDLGAVAVKELAKDGDVRLVGLDVTDDRSVSAAAKQIAEASGALDVLINNAGIAIGAGEGLASAVRLETVQGDIDVNFFGALRVAQAFLPLVRKAEHGRIVNVSSTVGSLSTVTAPGRPLAGYPTMFAYSASKTLLNALTGWLAVELDDTTIRVSSVCPGYTDTDINGHQGTQHPSEGAEVVVKAATLPADAPTGSFFDANGPLGW